MYMWLHWAEEANHRLPFLMTISLFVFTIQYTMLVMPCTLYMCTLYMYYSHAGLFPGPGSAKLGLVSACEWA